MAHALVLAFGVALAPPPATPDTRGRKPAFFPAGMLGDPGFSLAPHTAGPGTRRRKRASLLLGSSRWSGIAPLDVKGQPVLSSGALPEARRSETQGDPGFSLAWPRVCSVHHPLCIRPAPGTPDAFSLAALAAAERAWEALTGPLEAPAPEGVLGDAWQAYLVDGVEGGARYTFADRDPRSRFDRAASFGLVDRSTPPGCPLDFALARAVAWGSMWRGAPATDEGSARGEAQALARLATPCAAPQDDDDVAAFQEQPERCIVDPASHAFDRGGAVFFDWVDAMFGTEPGAVLLGMWALAPTRTPAQAPGWAPTPTGFDVLSVSLRDAVWHGSTLDDVFQGFAVARALMAPRARTAWHIPWPAQARRFASPIPLMPTGASYVLVDHAGAAPGAKLRLEAQWEDYGRLRWVVVKLDQAHRRVAEIPVTSLDRGTRASMTVDNLDGIDAVLVVGVNVGSTEHPFNPDQREWEPHGWLLTLGAE